jgi:hypothetical protein
MGKAVTLAPQAFSAPFELLRSLVVCLCALALICAGHALPF